MLRLPGLGQQKVPIPSRPWSVATYWPTGLCLPLSGSNADDSCPITDFQLNLSEQIDNPFNEWTTIHRVPFSGSLESRLIAVLFKRTSRPHLVTLETGVADGATGDGVILMTWSDMGKDDRWVDVVAGVFRFRWKGCAILMDLLWFALHFLPSFI